MTLDSPPPFRTVLELGCGVGLLGCVISHLCDQITLTDYHEAVIDSARHTIDINNVSNAEVSALDWTESRGRGEEELDLIVAAGSN